MNNYNNGERVYTVGDIDRLEFENKALKAQLDTLQKAIYRQQRKEGWYEEHPLVTLCVATPEHCLAEIKAQAGRDGFIEGVSSRACDYMTPQEVQKEASQYANQIRQQAKENTQ